MLHEVPHDIALDIHLYELMKSYLSESISRILLEFAVRQKLVQVVTEEHGLVPGCQLVDEPLWH